jgi:hypothetical protein
MKEYAKEYDQISSTIFVNVLKLAAMDYYIVDTPGLFDTK